MVDLWRTFIDPLHKDGYQWWSGIGSDLGEIPLIAGVYVIWRKHQCHHPRCHRVQFKPHPKDPTHVLCRRHHKETHGR